MTAAQAADLSAQLAYAQRATLDANVSGAAGQTSPVDIVSMTVEDARVAAGASFRVDAIGLQIQAAVANTLTFSVIAGGQSAAAAVNAGATAQSAGRRWTGRGLVHVRSRTGSTAVIMIAAEYGITGLAFTSQFTGPFTVNLPLVITARIASNSNNASQVTSAAIASIVEERPPQAAAPG